MNDNDDNIKKKMLEEYSYPLTDNENFQHNIYVKRDFYIHSIPHRKILESYEDVKKYRESICNPSVFKPKETQILLSNFINPDTPYRGVLIYHGTGVGKTMAMVAIAEKFKPMVEKYGTKIHVLVPGGLTKQNFINEIFKYTGELYMKTFYDKTITITNENRERLKKNGLKIISKYYKIMSHRTFYKKVLGEKSRENVMIGNKLKKKNRKTSTGEYEREYSVDRIYSLDNSVLIIDEAHGITNNEYGKAVFAIKKASTNLKIVLGTATPMKNIASEIVELINYLRPLEYPIVRDKVFNGNSGHQIEFRENGKKYFREMIRGYVSYLRGADPITFAERIDNGEIPPGLDFTKVIRCYMLPFQLKTYRNVIDKIKDALDKKSESIANFVFPGIPKDNTENNKIQGYFGIDGINEIKRQLKSSPLILTNLIANELLKEYNIKDSSSLLYLTSNNTISGDIYNEKYLKIFSIKFWNALKNINELVYGKRGPGLSFVYATLVLVGIEIFQEILQVNGYLEYNEQSSSYNIKSDTRCYFCDCNYGTHNDHIKKNIPKHKFYPATYLSVTGKIEDTQESMLYEKFITISNIFNNPKNKNGKYIKLVIGSKVMNEGISLKNIKEVHVLDVYWTIGRLDQVIGRSIRFCSHYEIINDNNRYPKVEINKYVVSMKNQLSNEEIMYKNAETKYKLIKQTERILHEEAIDCPLNISGNIFPEEIEKYGNCGTKENPCPAICGYMKCSFKCGNKLINDKYYDPTSNIYKSINKNNLDYSTYNSSLSIVEIEQAKIKILEMFNMNNSYTLDEIINYVKKSYSDNSQDMFDNYYVYKALDNLIPITINDFNNYNSNLIDKYNRPGYLIYRNKYYIFQQFNENEFLPMYYRNTFDHIEPNKISLIDYIQNTPKYKLSQKKYENENIVSEPNNKNNFNIVQEYYDNRNEFKYVGIIDREINKKNGEVNTDVFKIREARPKNIIKKRESGIPSFKGAVCITAKDKKYLKNISKKINLNIDNNTRMSLCEIIKKKLYDLEKYSSSTNKKTYLIVPSTHPTIPFPLNLEDRIVYVINNIQKETNVTIKYTTKNVKKTGEFDDITYLKYIVKIKNNMDKYEDIMKKFGATKIKNFWTIIFE